MYGIVNDAIRTMVEERFGASAWAGLCEGTGCPLSFASMEPYPDGMTYALVGAVAARLGVPESDVLHEFGRHWITHVAGAYGELFAASGSDTMGFLRNLDGLHSRVAAQMPGLTPPSFVVRGSAPVFELEYHSKRPGLSPMIPGVLRGLGERFGEDVDAVRTGGGDGFDTFEVRISAACGGV